MQSDESRVEALRDEIARLRAALQQADREAMIDPLTGCLNRRGWTRTIEGEEQRCARHGLDAVVVIVDLDGLKATNDVRGHAAGDRRLVECARAMHAALRTEDIVARLGGDEFAALAVQTAAESPETLAGRIERSFADAGVSASVGWALRSNHDGLAGAVIAADRCMLARKRKTWTARARR